MAEDWKMTRQEYVDAHMPQNAMGGGVCEAILARHHAIAVQAAMADGKRPPAAVVYQSHEILGHESTYPPKIVARYPRLKSN